MKATPSREKGFAAVSGWPMLAFEILFPIAVTLWLTLATPSDLVLALAIAVSAVLFILTAVGFFIVNPNMSRVLVLFGVYKGTVRSEGFYWVNPFTVRHHVSLRAHNLASNTIKVNDFLGNPIDIGAVVVWQVRDTAQAIFDVDDYEHYVDVQTEAAVRHMAKSHPYDDTSDAVEEGAVTLRGDSDVVADELQQELQQRFERAGIEVLEARLSHLAYAPEIASAMLQRQQASAIIAARRLIVEGAVSMVEQALGDLASRSIVELDDERRATMVGNLLVVLCGQSAPTPVLNTGSLYN